MKNTTERLAKPRWIPLKERKPREQDSHDGWIIFIDKNGRLYFNHWYYKWDKGFDVVAWCAIPFWNGEGLQPTK